MKSKAVILKEAWRLNNLALIRDSSLRFAQNDIERAVAGPCEAGGFGVQPGSQTPATGAGFLRIQLRWKRLLILWLAFLTVFPGFAEAFDGGVETAFHRAHWDCQLVGGFAVLHAAKVDELNGRLQLLGERGDRTADPFFPLAGFEVARRFAVVAAEDIDE